MKMHFLSGGRLRMRASIYEPDVPREKLLEAPVLCTLLRHAQGNVLYDTGCPPGITENAAARWNGMEKFMTPIGGPEENAISELAAIGFGPDDIDVVVCSHLHPDHCGCNGHFPRATVICHPRELERAKEPDAQRLGYLRADWDQPNPVQLVEQEHDLFGDGRVVLLPMPGHTPGMICAAVTLDRDGQFLLASDNVSLRSTLDADHAPRNTWNADALLRTFADIRRIEAQGATVICGHDDPQWRTLRKGAEFYE